MGSFWRCIKGMLIALGCLSDEITDVLYVYQNWNSFASIELKYASLAALCVNFFINLLVGFWLLLSLKKCRIYTLFKRLE